MNEHGKSDSPIVPGKSPNKDRPAGRLAEGMEERGLAKGNLEQQNRRRTQGRTRLKSALNRVRKHARRNNEARFTALWHHVYDVDRLRVAYFGLKRGSAPGVDGLTWQQYGYNLEENLEDLSSRLRGGAYRAQPVVRTMIPKSNGQLRPIGMPALEDKIVQRAATEVLNAIYEVDFVGFSYGFRPGRGQHNALDALTVGLKQRKVNWVLDADISGFFDAIDWEWLVKFIEHRIADRRVLRHVQKWLRSGVLHEGQRIEVRSGTPQGGNISPLLANIYLHYVFDLWIRQWRSRQANGDVIAVRYADDIVVGFENERDAIQFRRELEQRLQKFHLELNASKTRLIEYGRFAADNRRRRGEGKPETFDFLGFTHICGKTRGGQFQVIRLSQGTRVSAKLKALNIELKHRRHLSIVEQGKYIKSVLRGHYQYYGVPNSWYRLNQFRAQVKHQWYKALLRRSQRSTLTWERMNRLAKSWLPYPRIMHPYPEQRLCVMTQGRSPVR